jgi:hypothetical protein
MNSFRGSHTAYDPTAQSADSELASLRSQLAAVTGALGPAQRGLSLEAAVRRLVTEVTQVHACACSHPLCIPSALLPDSNVHWGFQGADFESVYHLYAVLYGHPLTLPSRMLCCGV